jgi:hypothetical protein
MSDQDTKDTYDADDSILNPSDKGEHTEVTETDAEGNEDTYDADDSILNPSGKGGHTEVTEPRDDDSGTKDTYEADDSILNPSGKGEHEEVTETRDDGTKDTYEADDSILNPSGKGEHTEVTETDEETGREDTYEADDSILNPSGKGEHTEVTEPRNGDDGEGAATKTKLTIPTIARKTLTAIQIVRRVAMPATLPTMAKATVKVMIVRAAVKAVRTVMMEIVTAATVKAATKIDGATPPPVE